MVSSRKLRHDLHRSHRVRLASRISAVTAEGENSYAKNSGVLAKVAAEGRDMCRAESVAKSPFRERFFPSSQTPDSVNRDTPRVDGKGLSWELVG